MQLLPDAVKPSLVFNYMNMKRSVARLLTNQTEYKLGAMVYRCLHDRAPRYHADHLIPASDAAPRRLRLRSANLNPLNRLTIPRCRLITYSPTVWNSLPDELRNFDSFVTSALEVL